jgi:hypothetical protein
VHARSTKPEAGEIDLDHHRPSARRDATTARERDEAAAFQKTDFRKAPRRKNRTELLAVRITPEKRAVLERIALAEGKSLTEIIEQGIDLLDRTMRGEKS